VFVEVLAKGLARVDERGDRDEVVERAHQRAEVHGARGRRRGESRLVDVGLATGEVKIFVGCGRRGCCTDVRKPNRRVQVQLVRKRIRERENGRAVSGDAWLFRRPLVDLEVGDVRQHGVATPSGKPDAARTGLNEAGDLVRYVLTLANDARYREGRCGRG